MSFHLAKLPHKLITNEWLAVSVPSVWWRLGDAAPLVGKWANDGCFIQRVMHNWVTIYQLSTGTRAWYVNGQLHRENGLPAVEGVDGSKWWYVNGQLHRENGLPAVEGVDGSKWWYVNGQRHRENGLPACEWADGAKEWYVNGQLHRENGLPACEWVDGSKEWWVNGKRVR